MHKFIAMILLTALTMGKAQAETIKATVNGMVCAFCVTGIEKTFKAQPAVESVKVDLDSRLVTINTKEDQTLDDGAVTKMITDAGFSVTRIERDKK